MSDIKTESLKQLAEYMNYEVRLSELNQPCMIGDALWVVKKDDKSTNAYNPIDNAEQCLELMEKFKFRLIYDFIINSWSAQTGDAIGEGKTINEAVTNAAIAVIKE